MSIRKIPFIVLGMVLSVGIATVASAGTDEEEFDKFIAKKASSFAALSKKFNPKVPCV